MSDIRAISQGNKIKDCLAWLASQLDEAESIIIIRVDKEKLLWRWFGEEEEANSPTLAWAGATLSQEAVGTSYEED